MENRNSNPPDLRLAFRIAWYGGAAAVVIAYAVLVPLKWHGLLPLRMTWSRLVLGPAMLGLMVPISMLITKQPRKRMFGLLFAWLIAVFVLFAVVSMFDPVIDSP